MSLIITFQPLELKQSPDSNRLSWAVREADTSFKDAVACGYQLADLAATNMAQE